MSCEVSRRPVACSLQVALLAELQFARTNVVGMRSTAKPVWGSYITAVRLVPPRHARLPTPNTSSSVRRSLTRIPMRLLVQNGRHIAALQTSGLRAAWTSHSLSQASANRGKVRMMTQALPPVGQELSLWRGGTSKGLFVGHSFSFYYVYQLAQDQCAVESTSCALSVRQLRSFERLGVSLREQVSDAVHRF